MRRPVSSFPSVRPAPRGRGLPRAAGRRGAVLIVALMLAALIAVGLGSYLNLNLSSTRLAKRTFNGYAALNLAEAGAEEAVWSFNHVSGGHSDGWTGWTTGGAAAWRKFGGFSFGGGTAGTVKVHVDNHAPSAGARPRIVALASVGATGEVPVTRMLEVSLRRRATFANGLVARDAVVFSGANASVDSWNSDPDNDPATAPVPYDPAIRRDRGSVASLSFVNTAVLVNNANIWGYVATGGAQPQVGSGGTIRGADTAPGVAVDPRRVATDFSAELNGVLAPADGIWLAAVPAVLGTAGAKTKWRAASLALSGSDTLTVRGDVTLVLTTAGHGDVLSVTGNASIIVPDGSSFTVYVEAGAKIGGRGLFNGNAQPASCAIYGTSTSPGGQEIQIAGNGALKCVVYAPNAEVRLNGNGDVMGSVVANRIVLVGNAAFHYDEALAQRENNEPFSISKWRELGTAGERAPYLPLFQGW
jgi:hypothetical protein